MAVPVYTYNLTINGTSYTLENIADSSTLAIVKPFCSTAQMSAKGTMSVTLKGAADKNYYATFMAAFLQAQKDREDCEIIVQENSATVFRGFVDFSEVLVASKKIPENLNLTATDKSILLDKKLRMNKFWENESRNTIISDIFDNYEDDWGVALSYISSDIPVTKKIGNYAVAEGKNKTYRNILDLLCFEASGYVLWYDPVNDGFKVRKVPQSTAGLTPREVSFLIADQNLTTKSVLYPNDGILLSFPTIKERANTNLYAADIPNDINDEGDLTGQVIPSGHYYPEVGDVKEVYQEYSVADRAYISTESRLQNEDLKLLYAKDVDYQIASSPRLSLAPALPDVHWDGAAKFYPDRARLLFINNSADDSNLTLFTLTGTAVYQDHINKVTVPDACANPEEYTAETIHAVNDGIETEAVEFGNWLYNSRRFGSTVSTWCELPGSAYLGEVVYVVHKDTGVQMPHVIVQITSESAGGSRVRQDRITAMSIYGWQAWTASTIQSNGRGADTNRANTITTGKLLRGKSTTRGYAGIVGDIYINDDETSADAWNIYRCITAGTALSAIWKYVGNIKGDPADLVSYTYELEFAFCTSPDEFIYPEDVFADEYNTLGALDAENNLEPYELGFDNYGGWGGDYTKWYKGLYVWQRLKATDQEGNVSYGEPAYAKELTESLEQSCKVEITANPAVYTINRRRTDYQYLHLNILSVGYKTDGHTYVDEGGSTNESYLTLRTDKGIFARLKEDGTWEDQAGGNVIQLTVDPEQVQAPAIVFTDFGIKLPYGLDSEVSVTGDILTWNNEAYAVTLYIGSTDETGQRTTFPTIDTSQGGVPLSGTTYTGEDGETYNYLNGDSYVLVTYPDANTKKSDIQIFLDGTWMSLDDNRNFYDFAQILLDNAPAVFEVWEGNHAVTNGYDFFKQIIAEHISSVYYYVGNGGAIYSGCFDRNGNVIPEKSDLGGVYISADGTIKAANIEISGNSVIGGDAIFQGTIRSEYSENGTTYKVFETVKSAKDTVVFQGVNNTASKAFRWQDVTDRMVGHYNDIFNDGEIVPCHADATYNNIPVKYMSLGKPALPSVGYREIGNTKNSDTYNEVVVGTLPDNYPTVRYTFNISKAYTNCSNFIGLDATTDYGKAVVLVDGTAKQDASSNGIVNITVEAHGGQTIKIRLYGDSGWYHNTFHSGSINSTTISDPIPDERAVFFYGEDAGGIPTFLGSHTSIIPSSENFADVSAGSPFYKVQPASWTGAEQSMSMSQWVFDVDQYYKLNITAFTENGVVVTDSKTRTVIGFSVRSFVYGGYDYSSRVRSMRCSTSAVTIILDDDRAFTFYKDSFLLYGAFSMSFTGKAANLGAYAQNMLPIEEGGVYEGSGGYLGTTAKPWKESAVKQYNILGNDNQWRGLLDFIYPIGSVYISLDATFNPNTTWGGTWSKISAGNFIEATETDAEVAGDVAAGLPNIKGSGSGTNYAGWSGALSGGSWEDLADDGRYIGLRAFSFNAANSNAMYSDSVTTVQPKAIKAFIWKRTA